MRPSVYPWYVAVLLSLSYAIAMLDRFVMGLVMVPLKTELGLSDAQLGLLFGTAFAVLFVTAGIPLGRLADLRSRRNVIAAGLFIWCIATAASGLVHSYGGLFVARVLVGVGEAALAPAAMSLLSAYFPRSKLARATAIFTLGAPLGRAAAFLGYGAILGVLVARGGLAVPLLERLAPWQVLFVLACLPGLLLLPLIFTIREPARERSGAASAATGLGSAFTHLRANLRAYLSHTGAFSAIATNQWALTAWGTSFFVREHHMSIKAAGAVIGIAGLTAPFGHFLGGFAMDRLALRGAVQAPRIVVLVVLLTGLVPAWLFATSGSPWISVAAFGVLQFVCSCAGPPGYAGLQLLTPEAHRGIMTSMFVTAFTLVSLGAGPAIVGLFSDFLAGGRGAGLGMPLLATLTLVSAAGLACVAAGRTAAQPLQRPA